MGDDATVILRRNREQQPATRGAADRNSDTARPPTFDDGVQGLLGILPCQHHHAWQVFLALQLVQA